MVYCKKKISKGSNYRKSYLILLERTCGQCYKASTSVNYDSRIILSSKLLIIMPLSNVNYDCMGFIRSDTDLLYRKKPLYEKKCKLQMVHSSNQIIRDFWKMFLKSTKRKRRKGKRCRKFSFKRLWRVKLTYIVS